MKRRDFVIKSGVIGTSVLAGTSVLKAMNVLGANDKINIGVIGTGNRGCGMISLMQQIEGIEVVACCDILPFRLAEGIKRAGKKVKEYNNYKQLLENKDVDAVLIATPFSTHQSIAVAALDANKHVFCEKTLSKGVQPTLQLLEKAKASKMIFQTGHQHRNSRLFKHVVALLQEDTIGQLLSFECQWNRFGDWRRPVPDPSLEKAINWRMYREYSGGLLAELCSHQIDFINWVIKGTPKRVMGTGGVDYWKDGRETYDNIHLIYEYDKGVKAKFTCLTANAIDNFQTKILGSKGAIVLDFKEAWIFPESKLKQKIIGDVDGVSGATQSWVQGKGYPIELEHIDPSKQALLDFKENIIANKIPITNVRTGANAAFAVQMGLDAMYNGTIEHWKEEYN